MIGVETGHVGGDQLVALWTWLLEGYVPVVPIVADIDQLEAGASNDSGEAPLSDARVPSARQRAA